MKKIFLLVMAALISIPSFAQDNNDTVQSVATSNNDDTYAKMLDYSRPGKFHQLLENLEGSWTYKGGIPDTSGKSDNYFYGTFVWKPFANGRFFISNVTSSKIQMPVQDGKTIETEYKAIFTIGYNNVKNRFEETVISNMLGSDIMFAEGTYDPATKTITFNTEAELVPGQKVKFRDDLIFVDKDHYTITSYSLEDGKYKLYNNIVCTRVKGK